MTIASTKQANSPEVYDSCFTVTANPWGTWVSRDINGVQLVTSGSQQCCIEATRFLLKMCQDNIGNAPTPTSTKVYAGSVGGKL